MQIPVPAPEARPWTSTEEPLVRLRGIEKSFDHGAGRFFVLRRIDLDVRPGEFVSVMGPSGAGKSTLLHLLGLQDGDWTGEYRLGGTDVGSLDARGRARLRNQNVGFVFQSYNLLDDLTVAENLDIPLSYRDMPKAERQALVADALDRFQIVGKKDLFPQPAFRRSAATRGRGASHHCESKAASRR